MGQQVNVGVLRKQITEKIDAIEKSEAKFNSERDEYYIKSDKMREKYDADCTRWTAQVRKAVAKVDVLEKAMVYSNEVRISIPEELQRTLPDKKDEKYSVSYPSNKTPRYYDHRNKHVDTYAVLFHLRKALDLLDALPNATPEVTVKDFDFLTKY